MTDLNPGWNELLAALAELPSIPTDADEQLEGVLRKSFNFYGDEEEDREAKAEQFPDQEHWGPHDHYGS